MAICNPAPEELDRLPTPLNAGERRVLDALLGLDQRWTVFVQPRLALIQPDFVLVHDDAGVVAVEVKDWKPLAYRAGQKRIEVFDGTQWQPLRESPLDQAKRCRDIIFDRFFALPDTVFTEKQFVRATVVLAQHAAGDAEGLLTSGRGVHVAGADLAALLQWLRDTAGREGPPPQKASLVRLRRHLGESEFTSDQRRALRLSEGARNLATNPDSARIRRARGPAGCGKSLGLAGRAVELAREDKRVLAVTFNITLAHYLHDLCSRRGREVGLGPRIRNITFSHFHAFCQDIHDQHADVRLPFAEDHLDRIVRAVDELYLSDTLAPRYDAVLVDEGQDFELSWWNLLRLRVLKEDGEMLLVADRSQDIYGRASWTSEESMRGAGFSGPWTNLKGTYRMPPDLVPVVDEFANQYLPAENLDLPTTATDHPLLSEASAETSRTWINTTATDLIQDAADAVEELLRGHPTLHPDDVVVLANYGSGKQLMDELQRRGHDTSHIYTTPGGDRARERQWRKRRFWGGTPGIKGCTVHSFKGWEARAVVAVLPI